MGKKYRMVSIDSSSTKTGLAYFEGGKLISSAVLDHSREKDGEIRLEDMCLDIVNTLNGLKPETVVIEMTVVERNAQTQRNLSEIVGVVRGWSLCNFTEFVEYRPSVWRKLIVGPDSTIPRKRDECKAWSVNTVRKLFNKAAGDDECDAILIGQARINEMEKAQDSLSAK